MKPQRRLLLLALLSLLLAGLVVASLACGLGLGTPATSDVPPEFRRVWEAYSILKERHVNSERFDAEQMSEAAIRGMLQELDDPYASFLTPEERRMQEEDLSGQFEGIGAEVAMRNGQVVIIAPMPDSPAERAGIRPGDTILAVNGEPVMGLTLMEVVNMVRGPRGTEVELTIRHAGESATEKVRIVRDVIRLKTVNLKFLEEDVALLRITSFSENTDKEVVDALRRVKDRGSPGLVVDVRNNPGGLLDSVINVASQFLTEGLVLYEVDGQGNRREWTVRPGGLMPDIPLVVLVNRGSASGAEVLAGALKDHHRATIVGTRTFGKGSVNILQPLSDGSGIYFTISHWYTPDGLLIEGNGLEPDIVVQEEPGRDAPLEKALEVLRSAVATP